MSRIWKNFRVNFMYWRFRNITRNRLRLQSWYRRRQPAQVYRPRGVAAHVYRHSARGTWIALLIMVCVLTAINVGGGRLHVSPSLTWAVSMLVVVLAVYWSLRRL